LFSRIAKFLKYQEPEGIGKTLEVTGRLNSRRHPGLGIALLYRYSSVLHSEAWGMGMMFHAEAATF